MSLKGTLVFSSGRGTDFDIWTLELGSGNLKQLTFGQDLNDFPRWSPDGSKIAYVSLGSDLIFSLWVMDRDGKNKRRLTQTIHAQHPAWSPDGSEIIFTANKANGNEIEVCAYNLARDSVSVLFSRPGIESDPCLSPDGSSILFTAANSDSSIPFADRDTEIWERDLRTGNERLVCSHPAKDHGAVYSPDGKRIAFVSHRNGRSTDEYINRLQQLKVELDIKDRDSVKQTILSLQALDLDSEIHLVDRDGSNMRQLTDNSDIDTGVRWSPCGRYLVYTGAAKGDFEAERLRIMEAETGEPVTFEYDRHALKREIGVDLDSLCDNNILMYLIPNFIERPFKRWYFGASFFGEERRPDWSAV